MRGLAKAKALAKACASLYRLTNKEGKCQMHYHNDKTTNTYRQIKDGLVMKTYTVHVFTSDKRGAGTDANVYFQLYGVNGDSGERALEVQWTKALCIDCVLIALVSHFKKLLVAFGSVT